MPVTIQPASMKIKNGNTFTAVDCLKGDNVDVQINGASITSNGVANIPVASDSEYGAVKLGSPFYVKGSDGKIYINTPTSAQIKAGSNDNYPIKPYNQHESVFYGLAKAAGDSTQAASSNAVGVYTPSAKTAIRSMLGVSTGVVLTEYVSGTTPEITCQPNVRYYCDEAVSTITIIPPAMGTCDVIFGSGDTPAVLTIAGEYSDVMFPAWFDYENLESNSFYEIMITDGLFGSVMVWQGMNSVVK